MSEDVKKVVFTHPTRNHAEFKIRLQYDSLKQTEFLRGVIEAYIKQDAAVMDFVDRLKAQKQSQSVQKRRTSTRLRETGQATSKKFGLDDAEIENIFDIIEKEHSDL